VSQRRHERGPVVIDTGVFGADLVPGSPLTVSYEPVIAARPSFVSFQTVAELRYGALRRGWNKSRMLKLGSKIDRAEVVWAGPELVETYAKLRAECEAAGHALAQRPHDADRWIAATAVRLGIPLVSHDSVFRNVPGLILETMLGEAGAFEKG
jgi:predicted nucleic acid-binding protein